MMPTMIPPFELSKLSPTVPVRLGHARDPQHLPEVVTGVLGAMITVEDGHRQQDPPSSGVGLVKGINEQPRCP